MIGMRFILIVIALIVISCATRQVPVSLTPHERELQAIEMAEIKLNAGIEYLEEGKFDNAEKIFFNLIKENSPMPEFHNNLGVLYKRKGLINEAIREYKEAIMLNENYYEAHNNLGLAYRESGEFAKALQEYEAAISINPMLPDSYYNQGILYDLYMDSPEHALESFKKYIEIVGDDQLVKKWIEEIESR